MKAIKTEEKETEKRKKLNIVEKNEGKRNK